MRLEMNCHRKNHNLKCTCFNSATLRLLRRSFCVGCFGPDPHADPHGERSGRKQWRQGCQRALISEQKVLKMSKNHYFYRFSTLRNQQVAGSSPATSSTKPVKIERFSPVFSFICSDFQASKLPDPNRDPHGEMSKERRRG